MNLAIGAAVAAFVGTAFSLLLAFAMMTDVMPVTEELCKIGGLVVMISWFTSVLALEFRLVCNRRCH